MCVGEHAHCVLRPGGGKSRGIVRVNNGVFDASRGTGQRQRLNNICACVYTCVCVWKANKLASDEGVIHHTRSYAKLKKDVSARKKETEGSRKVVGRRLSEFRSKK